MWEVSIIRGRAAIIGGRTIGSGRVLLQTEVAREAKAAYDSAAGAAELFRDGVRVPVEELLDAVKVHSSVLAVGLGRVRKAVREGRESALAALSRMEGSAEVASERVRVDEAVVEQASAAVSAAAAAELAEAERKALAEAERAKAAEKVRASGELPAAGSLSLVGDDTFPKGNVSFEKLHNFAERYGITVDALVANAGKGLREQRIWLRSRFMAV